MSQETKEEKSPVCCWCDTYYLKKSYGNDVPMPFRIIKELLLCSFCQKSYICACCAYRPIDMGWFSVYSHCSICDRVACNMCVKFCHDCQENNEKSTCAVSYCPNHNPGIRDVNCKDHWWDTCGKHNHEKTCGECRCIDRANKLAENKVQKE